MVDLGKIHALLASVAGFTEGPWRMSIENGSGIVAGHRHAVVSADSSALGWPVVWVERRSRPVMLAAPDLHRELMEAVGEIERLRAHNARMAAQINRLAEGCGRAARHRDPSYPAIGHIITTLPGECAGQDWADLFAAAEVALGRLAAGEVDDG